MGEKFYFRSCQYCGFACDGRDLDNVERARARDAHEIICKQNPTNKND